MGADAMLNYSAETRRIDLIEAYLIPPLKETPLFHSYGSVNSASIPPLPSQRYRRNLRPPEVENHPWLDQ